MAATGIRALRDHLSHYLDRVRAGEELTITDRGTAIARIVPVSQPRPFDRLVREGLIDLAPTPARRRPAERQRTHEPVSDLVSSQRR